MMLKDDHRTVEKLFKRYEDAGDRAYAEKRKVVDRIIEELSVHAAVEEQLFYPVTRATVPAVEDTALESLEEHHIVKWVLSELEHMDPEDERFDAKVAVLIDNVRHHVKEEESEYFPEVRQELGRKALGELGEAMAAAKQTAPTRPHPRSPDTPPGNIVAGSAAAVVDRVGSTVSGLAQGGVTAAQDLIDRILGNPRRRRPAPTGSRQARSTAASVRGGADEAVDRVVAAVRAAESGGEATVGQVRAGAASTARAASSGASRVAGDVRTTAGKTADAASSTVRSAADEVRSGARKTAGTAASGARSTADDARSGAARTARTASSSASKTRSTARSATRRTARAAQGRQGRTTTTGNRSS
jgi:hemerythrin-like domain-containing protein/uncharacterized protein YjbJ (UPF0337 family)